MNREEFDYVQSAINYHFNDTRLLEQAFTRKSYAAEHPEAEDNETLEFYGDGILDFFVTKTMYETFGKIADGRFVSEKNEGELTKLKSIFVSKESLARCMYNFGFARFLRVGKSDEQSGARENLSVNEDLFEAIIGAVAADCGWDFSTLEKLCRTMLHMETTNGYLSALVKEKSNALGFGEPVYHPMSWQIQNGEDMPRDNLFNARFGVRAFATSKNPKTGLHEYWISVGGRKFKGTGEGVFQAKLDADKKAYQFLCQEEIKRQFQTVDYANPASALHELFQKKIIMETRYEYGERHDENGNPIWRCKATLEGYGTFDADNVSKKQAKQNAALKLLRFIIDTKVETSGEWETPTFYMGRARFRREEGGR